MKTSLATTLSIIGVLATGGVAMAVNTTVLDSTVSSVEGSPALAEANVTVSALSVDSPVPSETVLPMSETTLPTSETTLAPTSVQSAYDVEGAGIVTLEQNAPVLNIVSVNPVSGWTYKSTVEDTNRVEVEFTNGTQNVKFTAELLDGRIITAVEATDTSVAPPRKNDDQQESSDDSGHDSGESEVDDD